MNCRIDCRLLQESVRIFLLARLAYQQELWWIEGKMRKMIGLKPVILDLEEGIDQIHHFPLAMHMGEAKVDETCILGKTQLRTSLQGGKWWRVVSTKTGMTDVTGASLDLFIRKDLLRL